MIAEEPSVQNQAPQSLPRAFPEWRRSAITCTVLASSMFAWSWTASGRLGNGIFHDLNTYYQADLERVYENMNSRWSQHGRTRVHPLFSLICGLPTLTIVRLSGLDAETVVRSFVALTGATWAIGIFVLFRLLGLARTDATVFTILCCVCAAPVFWFSVPETFPFGAVSILVPLLVLAGGSKYALPRWMSVLASALSLSITSTNWMAGLLCTAFRHRARTAIQLSIQAFVIVNALWLIQKAIYPSARYFIADRKEESQFMRPFTTGNVLVTAQNFFLNSVVMPEPTYHPDALYDGRPFISVEDVASHATSYVGQVALYSWIGLLALSSVGLFTAWVHRPFRLAIVLLVSGQLLLHTLYGDEIFLYSLHFGPLLVIIAGISCMSRFRPLVLAAAMILIPCLLANNLQKFDRTVHLFRNVNLPRLESRTALLERPTPINARTAKPD